jgi:RNA polymerase sigma-70 factor (ECF subfamily)
LDSIETAVQGVKEGKADLFESIVDHYQQPLFRYCYRMLGNVQEAEDAVQEVFFNAFCKIEKYNKAVSFSAWIYKITYNHCINIIRRKRIFKFVPFMDVSEHDDGKVGINLEMSEINRELNEVLQKLSSDERCILILKNIEEKSFEDIALILDAKSSTIRKRYERLRKKLKNSLAQNKGGIINENYSVN